MNPDSAVGHATTTPAEPAPWQHDPSVAAQQRRSVRLLIAAQVLGSFGMGASASVGVLLTEEVIQQEALAGIARTALTLGAALLGVPLAYLAARRGRRVSLAAGWGLGALGAATLILAAVTRTPALVVGGMLLFGAGTAAGLQTRFSSTDLAAPARRGRTLSFVVWAGMFGSVLGPNLGLPGEWVAARLGLPVLAGAFVIAALLLAGAAVILFVLLRPDPLLTAQAHDSAHLAKTGAAPAKRVPFRTVLGIIGRVPAARFALAAVIVSHVSMVALMTMTPVHLQHNGATITIIGITISAHVLGMFAFAPLVGLASDRFGPVVIIVAGQLIFVGSAVSALVVGEHSAMMMPSVFLLGLGWSCGTVPGSILISTSVPSEIRIPTQGVVDTSMNGVAAIAAFLSGPAYVITGYSGLATGVIILATLLTLMSATLPRPVWRLRRPQESAR
ncbi:MFS transporter [Microlunatus sp. GCM10028923]|uniref:MFS transporter n=1 Tax=Microlunatus sp. GCM10028923 TaxID=3273400 RepID=UPI0036132369